MISVIIPTYKGSDKVLLPIYSAVQQSYSDVEIIVVDDNGLGSREQVRTECALKPLIEKKVIRYIPHEENRNGSAARNTGFRASKGEYVNFLDDDDYLMPDKLREQKKVLDASPQSVCAAVCGSYFVHEDGKGFCSVPDCEVKHLQREYLCERARFNTSAILFRRQAVQEFGGFDETFRRHQDWEFCIRLMSRYSFANCNRVLLTKYATGRNIASNPETAVAFYKHFTQSLAPFISELDEQDQREIEAYHLRRLYKSYIMSKRLKDAVKYANESGMSAVEQGRAILELSGHAAKRFLRPNKQLAKPSGQYIEEAAVYWNMTETAPTENGMRPI